MKILKAITPALIALLLLAGALIPLPEGKQDALAAPLFARSVMTPTAISTDGASETMYSGVDDGMQFSNNNETWVRVLNNDSSTITATFITPRQIAGLDIADLDIAVAAGTAKLVGPFPAATYNNAGRIVYINLVTSTAAASISLGAFYLE